MELSHREKTDLRWLARQSDPAWGGIVKDGKREPEVDKWEAAGLVRRVVHPTPGFVITEKGRNSATSQAPQRCPSCGQLLPKQE